jgi:hypothetical protein
LAKYSITTLTSGSSFEGDSGGVEAGVEVVAAAESDAGVEAGDAGVDSAFEDEVVDASVVVVDSDVAGCEDGVLSEGVAAAVRSRTRRNSRGCPGR